MRKRVMQLINLADLILEILHMNPSLDEHNEIRKKLPPIAAIYLTEDASMLLLIYIAQSRWMKYNLHISAACCRNIDIVLHPTTLSYI